LSSQNLEAFELLQRRVAGDSSEGALVPLLQLLDPDVEMIQPPSLPHGGTHRGHDGVRAMAATMRDHWALKFDIDRIWDLPENDTLFVRVIMEWTAHSTGRSARFPALELVEFREGRVLRAEIFVQDTSQILATL
jgi:ketosteroid isomerase-like protein